MALLLVYLYVQCIIFLSMVMHMHAKIMNTFGNCLINKQSNKFFNN